MNNEVQRNGKKYLLILGHGNPEAINAEQIKHRLKAYRKKLISDIEPSALASVLSKSFPKCDFDSVDKAGRCQRRVERLLLLVEKGEPNLVKEFVTVLKNFGYHDIAQLIDPPDICQTASMYILVLCTAPFSFKSYVKLS